MTVRNVSLVLTFCVGVIFSTFGQHKKALAKKDNHPFILLDAFTQRVLPVRTNVTPTTGQHFIIVWEAPKFPETFYWRGDTGWLPCKIMSAHKVVCKSPEFPDGLDYTVSHVKGDDIKPGDTLELTPMLRARLAPATISNKARNTIFYRAGKSGWLSYHVDKIAAKADVTLAD